ncbi:MAG: hypothetical protein GF405_02980 [Candidatus Eisenbacteria bacterium]|nr:hypothetical protein [Candidatus Eisenbacteria bacterium]
MPSRSFSLQRLLLSILTVAAAGAALLLALDGRGTPNGAWERQSGSSEQGTYAFEMSLSEGGWPGVVLDGVLEPSTLMSNVCGADDQGFPYVVFCDYAEPEGIRVYTTEVRTTAGDTVAHLVDTRLVSALPSERGAPDLLTWLPEVWCEPVGNTALYDTVGLFLHNYASEFRFSDPGTVERAVARAARGESLVVVSGLSVVGSEGAARQRFPLDPRYVPGAGVPYRTGGESVVIAESDIGYQNTDLFHMLFDQPTLDDGDRVKITDTDDLGGSHRGLLAVAPERQRVAWYRRLGVLCLRHHVVDLDGDGSAEILLETYGAENDVSGGGTTDAGCAYVLCLDQGGNILWRHRVHGVYVGTQAAAAELADSPGLEVAVTWSSGYSQRTGGAVVLSAGGEVLARRDDLGGLYGLVVADVDGDGNSELATGGPDRHRYLLSAQLAIEASSVSDEDLLLPAGGASGPFMDCGVKWRSRTIPVAAADLTGDGLHNVVAVETAWSRWDDVPGGGTLWCGRGDLVVLDAELEEHARAACDWSSSVSGRYPNDMPACMRVEAFPLDTDADGEDELSVWMRTGGVYVFDRCAPGG